MDNLTGKSVPNSLSSAESDRSSPLSSDYEDLGAAVTRSMSFASGQSGVMVDLDGQHGATTDSLATDEVRYFFTPHTSWSVVFHVLPWWLCRRV